MVLAQSDTTTREILLLRRELFGEDPTELARHVSTCRESVCQVLATCFNVVLSQGPMTLVSFRAEPLFVREMFFGGYAPQ
jgi:hypothetical protein